MKKFSFMAVMAIAAATMVSCGGADPKADMKSGLDSLSYAFGVVNAAQLENQVPVDSAFTDEFYKGVKEGFNAADDKKQEMYFLGLQVGQYLNGQIQQMDNSLARTDSTLKVARQNFLAGFLNRYKKVDEKMTADASDSLINVKMSAYREQAMLKEYGDYKKECEKYIEMKSKEEGVQKTEGGVYYRVIKQGTGDVATDGQKVKLHYEGKLIDGTVFDSSTQRGDEPVEFPVNGVIPGFSEVLKLMPAGSEWEVYIPQELAYGAQQAGAQIKPFSALTFNIKTIEVVK